MKNIYKNPESAEYIDKNTYRFFPKDIIKKNLPPSFALKKPVSSIKNVKTAQLKTVPIFQKSSNRNTAIVKIKKGTGLYGTGEVAGSMLRNGKTVTAWNTDSFGYTRKTKSLYQSHPWVLAVRKDGTSFGVLADTTYKCTIDLKKDIKFISDGPGFPIIIIESDSPIGILKKLADLTGKIELPPIWALGYHQCRYSYESAKIVRNIADEFRKRKIPCDVIWMDIDYMDEYRVFTFNKNTFPSPKQLNNYLHTKKFKSIWMIDPGIKVDENYFVYQSGTKKDLWVKKADGSTYIGEVWPGLCVFPDFTRAKTRKWWASLYKDFVNTGIDGVWNDMNEPAIFNVKTKTMPEDNIHLGGGDIPKGTHAQYHNVYGMLMVKATREGIKSINPAKRPFVLTRANFTGGHRYAATWTGDNRATWEHLKDSVSMILNLGLSGQPFCGPDIGGFVDKGNKKLFARWLGVGAFFPFCRGHTLKGNINKEPWAFGEKVEKISRTALERRYRLLPYIYTLFHEASKTGLPVMRPLFLHYPQEPSLRAEDTAFLLGSDLLVVPQLSEHGKKVILPPGVWRDIILINKNEEKNINQPVLKIRGGAIIPLGKIVQSTTEKLLDPLTLIVCADENGKAEGLLYEDAGDGYGYKTGKYLLTKYSAERKGNKILIKISKSKGKMKREKRNIIIEVVTGDGIIRSKGLDGENIIVTDAGKN